MSATRPCGEIAATKRRARRRNTGRIALLASVAAVAIAAFPAFASAFTAAPVVVGVNATPSANGVAFNASIYPYGLDTTYHYEYGTTTSYGTNVPVPDADAGSAAYPAIVSAPQSASGLQSNTTYHYRLVAVNSDGTTPSTDQTFTTTGPAPTVTVAAATPIADGFTLSGTVNPNGGATTYHFEYGTSTSYGTSIPVPDGSAGSGSTASPVSQDVANGVLLPNTTYHFRLVAHNGGGTTPSGDQTFTTAPSAPGAPSAVVSPPIVIAGGYRLEGAINPNSIDTTYHFEFGATTGYGTNLPMPDADVGSGSVAVPVTQDVTTSLAPNTTYHYRIVAMNTDGTTPSVDQTFTTPPAQPDVVATPVTQDATGSTLNGTVNAHGGATTYHFQFGFTTAYGSNVPGSDADAGSATGPVAVSQLVSGLPPGIVYHYRLVAHNAGGTSTSGDQVFTTPSDTTQTPPTTGGGTVPPITITPPPVVPPTNQFTIRPAIAKGTAATLQVSVPGPGTVTASGKQLKPAKASTQAAGMVALKLKLTGAGVKALGKAKGHKLSVKVKVTFQPTGGSPGTSSKTVTFRKAG